MLIYTCSYNFHIRFNSRVWMLRNRLLGCEEIKKELYIVLRIICVMQRLGFKSTCVQKAYKTGNWLNACSSQKGKYGWQWKRGTCMLKLNFFLELNRTKLNILSLHCSSLNISSYWFLDVPDQLSWRRQRHPRKNSAVEKLSQTGFVVLEGHQWWLTYELPSSNTSGTCEYKQNFCYWLELLMSLTTLFITLTNTFLPSLLSLMPGKSCPSAATLWTPLRLFSEFSWSGGQT